MKNRLTLWWILAGALALAVVILSLVRPKLPDSARDQATVVSTSDGIDLIGKRFEGGRASLSTPASAMADPRLEWLAEPVPPAAQPYLIRAVETARYARREASQFSEGSHGQNLMIAVGRKLFIDDYRYAARATGTLDPERGQEVYDRFQENVTNQPIVEVRLPEQALPPGFAAELLAEHYEAMFRNPNPVYKEIWEIIAPYDPGAETDLLKDALGYATLYMQVEEWRGQIVDMQHEEAIRSAELAQDPTVMQTRIDSFNELGDARLSEYVFLQAALQNLFMERFRSRGIEPEIIHSLRGLPMDGVGGRDFEIP
jgi:hypothetical protein